MEKGKKRRRMLHRTGLLTLLVGGAMVLSGCWGVVVGPDASGKKALVISPNFTRQILEVHCGGVTSFPAARCTLDAIWGLCHNYPLDRMSAYPECARLTWHQYIPLLDDDMLLAMGEVIEGSDVCLVGYLYPNGGHDWTGSPRGFACN